MSYINIAPIANVGKRPRMNDNLSDPVSSAEMLIRFPMAYYLKKLLFSEELRKEILKNNNRYYNDQYYNNDKVVKRFEAEVIY